MATTGYVYSPRYLQHDTGPYHPERPQRLQAIHERLVSRGLLSQLELVVPRAADLPLLERVHRRDYLERLRVACESGAPFIDTPECPLCHDTFEIARLAVGGVINAVDAVVAGRIRNAFCAVRPPGHHAENHLAMGFCFLNNIAVAAEHLRANHHLDRVAILDWDVHHGNGTQHHFDRDPHVLYCSIHQDPNTIFPGTGFAGETGIGPGAGTTLNVPMMPGRGDEDYQRAFEKQILPTIEAFKPEFILVSAGFDAHEADPLANIRLSTEAFGWMTRQAKALAESLCQGRVVSVLEGGYNLAALADSVQLHVEVLAGLEAGRSTSDRG